MVLGYWADNTVWGFWADTVDWTSVDRQSVDNIVWGQARQHRLGSEHRRGARPTTSSGARGLQFLTKVRSDGEDAVSAGDHRAREPAGPNRDPAAPARLPIADVATSDWRQACRCCRRRGSRCASCGSKMRRRSSRCSRPKKSSRFISPPPTTVEGFERFIDWAHRRARERQLRLLRRRARRHDDAPSGSSRCDRSTRCSASPSGASRSAPRSGAPACSSMPRGSSSTSRSTRLACIGSRRARRWPTAAATARCARSARCRRASCADRSCATASITTR